MSDREQQPSPTEADIRSLARRHSERFCRIRRLPADWRDDVEQEVTSTLLMAAPRFDPTLGVPFASFTRLAMHGAAIRALADRGGVSRSHWRSGRRPARGFGEGEEPADRNEPAQQSSDERDAARDALDSLPPLARRVLRWHVEDRCSPVAIARRERLTLADVDQLIREAMAACRRHIRSACPEERNSMAAMNLAERPTTAVAASVSYAAIFLELFDASFFRTIVARTHDRCVAEPESAARRMRELLQLTERFERIRRAARADVFTSGLSSDERQATLFPSPATRDQPSPPA